MKEKEIEKNSTTKLAEFVSNVFNPGFLAILILLVAVYESQMPHNVSVGWYIGILVLNGVIPGMVYWFFTSKGYVFDDTLHNEDVHRERVYIYGIFLLLTTIELLVIVSAKHFYQPLYATLVGGIVAIIIAGVLSYFWKVSMHSSMITFFVLMFVLMFGPAWWPVILLIPVVWWSRLVLYRHTIWQLLVGMILSVGVALGTFWFFGLI